MRRFVSLVVLAMIGLAQFVIISKLNAQAVKPSAPSEPRVMALLVAVVDYSHSRRDGSEKKFNDISSTVADAALMAATLSQRGAQAANIRILTDGDIPKLAGLPKALQTAVGNPTHTAIIAELSRLESLAKEGDQVVLHLSGHGHQQRSTDDRSIEPDGLDEVFITLDSESQDGRWVSGLVDNELGERIKAIRAKGASVYLIADFCHSAGSSRSKNGSSLSAASDVRLGDGETDPETVQAKQVGGFAAFYAAPAPSEARAVMVPYWQPSSTTTHGALTFYLASALRNPHSKTVGELQTVLDRDVRMHAARASFYTERPPPPQFEGPVDMPLPGIGSADTALAKTLWTVTKPETKETDGRTGVERLVMQAGYLQGVHPGAVYRLTGAPGDRRHKLVLYGRAETVSPDTTILVPHSLGGIGASIWANLLDDENQPMIQEWSFIADLAVPASLEPLSISLPELSSRDTAPLGRVLARVSGRLNELMLMQGEHIRLVPHGASSPMRLRWEAGDLVLEHKLNQQAQTTSPWTLIARFRSDLFPLVDENGRTTSRAVTALGNALIGAGRFVRLREVIASGYGIPDLAAQDVREGIKYEAFVLSPTRMTADGKAPCVDPAPDWVPGQSVPTGARSIEFSLLNAPGTILRCDRLFLTVTVERSKSIAEYYIAQQSGVPGSLPRNWEEECLRPSKPLNPSMADACDQSVDIAVVSFNQDWSVQALSASPLIQGATHRLQANGRKLTFSYHVAQPIEDGGVSRVDLALFASRAAPGSGIQTNFDRFCQTSVQGTFEGSRLCGRLAHLSSAQRGAALSSINDPLTDALLNDVDGRPTTGTRTLTAQASQSRTIIQRFGADVTLCPPFGSRAASPAGCDN